MFGEKIIVVITPRDSFVLHLVQICFILGCEFLDYIRISDIQSLLLHRSGDAISLCITIGCYFFLCIVQIAVNKFALPH